MSDAPPVGFDIDGQTYDVPLPHTFDLDEARIYYGYTGTAVEFILIDDLSFSDLFRSEGFLPALVHIAYRRGNPDVADGDIRAVVGKQNRIELFAGMAGALLPGEDDEPGKDERATSAPDESSRTSNGEKPNTPPSSPDSSGSHSTPSSVPPVVARATTGITGSGTPSTSDLLRRVV